MIKIGIIDLQDSFSKGLAITLGENHNNVVLLRADNLANLREKIMPENFDLFFIAVHTPALTGKVTAEWLHKNFPLIRLIAISSENKYIELEDMFNSGCIAFFSKWISSALLLQSLKAIMENNFHSKLEECIDIASFRKATRFNGMNLPVFNDLDRCFAKWFVTSLNNEEIAIEMNVSTADVDYHKRTFFRELEVHNRAALILKLLALGY